MSAINLTGRESPSLFRNFCAVKLEFRKYNLPSSVVLENFSCGTSAAQVALEKVRCQKVAAQDSESRKVCCKENGIEAGQVAWRAAIFKGIELSREHSESIGFG